MVKQAITKIPHPSTPPPLSPPPHTPTPTPLPHTPTPTPPPPPPPPLFNMANSMKITILRGLGIDDPQQLWFVVDAVWKSQHITDDDLNKVQLVTTLQDRALS